MRKLVFYLVIAMLAIALIGCGGNTETDVETDGAIETEAPENESTEHVHEIVVDEEPATCSARGLRKEYCAGCGEVFSEEATPKLKHAASGATACTEDVTCTQCGEVMETAKGHTWGEVQKTTATCTENGKEGKSCTVCASRQK